MSKEETFEFQIKQLPTHLLSRPPKNVIFFFFRRYDGLTTLRNIHSKIRRVPSELPTTSGFCNRA